MTNIHSIIVDIEWFVTEGADNDLQNKNTNNDSDEVCIVKHALNVINLENKVYRYP